MLHAAGSTGTTHPSLLFNLLYNHTVNIIIYRIFETDRRENEPVADFPAIIYARVIYVNGTT